MEKKEKVGDKYFTIFMVDSDKHEGKYEFADITFDGCYWCSAINRDMLIPVDTNELKADYLLSKL
jgi:hypothetical protein